MVKNCDDDDQKEYDNYLSDMTKNNHDYDWDEFDDYYYEKMLEQQEEALALQPQRDLEEQEVMDELFPEK